MHGTPSANSLEREVDLRQVGLDPNFWYPLALTKDLHRGQTQAVEFAGDPIVLVRTKDDKFYALEDRCAHRQVPLSRGVVVGDRLRCGYHGWTYDQSGACTSTNIQPRLSCPRGVKSYPTREVHGLIFVFPGDPTFADVVPFPEFPECESRNFLTIPFTRVINCHYSFMHENLMDMSHQFLHRRWMGAFSPKPLAVRKGSDYVEVDYTSDLTEGGIYLRTLPAIVLKLQRSIANSTKRRVVTDARDVNPIKADDFVTVATRYPYQALTIRRPGLDEPLLKLWLAYVPIGRDQKVNRPNGFLIARKPRVPGLIYALRPILEFFANAIFREDRRALEAEQRAYDLQGGDWNQEMSPFILDLRKLLIARGIQPH